MSAILDWPRSPSQVERLQSERKRRAVELARRAPFFRDRLGGVDIDRLDDPADVGEDSAAHQGRAAANSAGAVSRRVLRRAARRGRGILALGRRHRTAAVLSALRARHGIQHPLLPPRLRGHRRDRGRSRPRLLPARHPSRGAPLCARRRGPRDRNDLVRLGRQHALAEPARAHPRAQAHDLGRHGELRDSPCQSGGSAGDRPRRLLGPQDHRGRRAALAGQASEARALVGRGSLRPVRHDRRRAGVGAVAAA